MEARNRAGFTLLELLIVMALLTLAASIAVPNFVNAYHESRLRAGARLLLSACHEARELAIRQREPVRLELDLENQRFVLTQRTALFSGAGSEPVTEMEIDPGEAFFTEMTQQTTTPDPMNETVSVRWEFVPVPSRFGREHPLPPTVRVVEARSLEEGTDVEWVAFYPDGEADGVLLVLENEAGHRLGIEIDAVNGTPRLLSETELEERAS